MGIDSENGTIEKDGKYKIDPDYKDEPLMDTLNKMGIFDDVKNDTKKTDLWKRLKTVKRSEILKGD